jgi:hypothetical protein
MSDSHRFAVDVLDLVCHRFEAEAGELRLLAEGGSALQPWLVGEAYLACKARQSTYPFCEVTVKPPYGGTNGENVRDEDDNPLLKRGDLRVGATLEQGDHRWVFAEFAVLHDGIRDLEQWRRKVEKSVSRLKRLHWVNSIALLVIVVVNGADRSRDLDEFDVWNRPPLTEPFACPLPDGGSLVIKAFDIKQNESDVKCLV